MTFDDLLNNHIDLNHHSPATIKSYGTAVGLLQRDIGVTDVTRLSVDDIETWKSQVLARASGSTWNNYHRHMRALITSAIHGGLVDMKNPFSRVKQVRKPKEREKVCKLSEIANAIELIENNPSLFQPSWFWIATIKIFYYTGMRRRQLVGLQWRDIDYEKKALRLSISHSKTKESWDVPITKNVKEQMQTTWEHTIKLMGEPAETDQIFNITLFNQRYKGQIMTADQVSGMFKKLRQLGFTISPHKLRHTMATEICNGSNLESASIQLRTLQQQLGHADITTTAKYMHPNINAQATMLEKLTEI